MTNIRRLDRRNPEEVRGTPLAPRGEDLHRQDLAITDGRGRPQTPHRLGYPAQESRVRHECRNGALATPRTRARRALDRAGSQLPDSIVADAHTALLEHQDRVAVMTREHLHEVQGRLIKVTAEYLLWPNVLEPGQHPEVPDPHYGDDRDFDECVALLSSGGRRWTSVLRQQWGEHSCEV